MKRKSFLALVALGGISLSARAQDSATLFVDPVAQITAVDGDTKRNVLLFDARADHGLGLSPGAHSLDVCFERNAGNSAGYDARESWKCITEKKIALDAKGGRLYRLKVSFQRDDWKAWIDDVTDTESALLAKPVEPKQKGGGKSLVLLKITPADMSVSIGSGRVEHIWFMPGMFGTFVMSADPAEGFMSRRVSAGATLAIMDITSPNKSLIPVQTEFLCGETKIPVLENLPGAGAYYLGEFNFTKTPQGPLVEVKHEGLDAAREYLKKIDPKLAEQLQPAPLQWKRRPVLCPMDPRGSVHIDAS